MRYICTSIVATLVLAGTSLAATINVPGDYATIQGAINASSDGDVINISPGTYNEHNLNPLGKQITIQGTVANDGALETIIDANQSGRVFLIANLEGLNTVIRDLVVRGGRSSNAWGGGFLIEASSPTIENCHIHSNTAINCGGGAIALFNGSPHINNCRIEGNNATNNRGGGICCRNSSFPVISHCMIQNNSVTNGNGGGVYAESWGYPEYDSNPSIDNSFICGNSPDQISGPWTDGGNNGVGATCNIGGCCLDNGASCDIMLQSYCQNSGGIYLGNGMDCATYNCNDDDGDGVLNAVDVFPNDPNEWIDSDGDGMGDNEDLAPLGACCVASGCDLLAEYTCAELGGTWLGEGSSCDDCPASCTGDTDGNGVVNIEDLLNLIGAWGACP